jgi:hypothetical protein
MAQELIFLSGNVLAFIFPLSKFLGQAMGQIWARPWPK